MLSVLFLVITSNAYAIEVYQKNPFKINQTPTLCEIEPTDNRIPYISSMMISTTHDSVNEWLKMLNQNSPGKQIWNINEMIIPSLFEKTYNYTNCDIQIRYLPQPKNQTDVFDTAGQISLDFQKNKTRIEIYYLQIVNKISPSEEYGYQPIKTYSNKTLDYFSLKQAISHELGHAFGLSHYITNDTSMMEKWSKGIVKPPSIMVPVQGENAKYFGVTQNDAKQIVSKYGKNGFGGNKTFGLPHDLNANYYIYSQVPNSTEPAYCIKDNAVSSGSKELLREDESGTGASVLFKRTPDTMYPGCSYSWTFEFVNSGNSEERISDIHYDIRIQQDVTRTVAKEQGVRYFNATNGIGTNDITINEKVGVINFWVLVVNGQTSPDQKVVGSSLLLLPVSVPPTNIPQAQKEISPWVKTAANLWATDEISEDKFVQAIQYLQDQKMIQDNTRNSYLPEHVPLWFKKSVEFWYNDETTDNDLIHALQFLIDEKLIRI